MIVILRRRHLLTAVCGLFFLWALWACTRSPRDVAVYRPQEIAADTVVLDAGHGGADGGAVSSDGVVESSINLAVTKKTAELFAFLGQDTVLTRTDEEGLYNDDSVTIREKKVADTHNRVELVNHTEGAVLISIHQNAIPSSPSTHGAQVFFNSTEVAQVLAQAVQEQLNHCINRGNEKTVKAIPKSVYIMNHVSCPAILVECGFLSNSSETALLQTGEHQLKLAQAIVCGYLSYKG